MWCDSCAAKDQEIADLKRKTQAADEQLLELRNTATEATEAWNSWERSCEQKDAEIAELKRRLELVQISLEFSRADHQGTIGHYIKETGKLERQLEAARTTNREWLAANAPGGWIEEARKDTERLREVAELLDLMYTKWENGDPCYEDIETHSGYLGSAFDLTRNEENRIIAALEAVVTPVKASVSEAAQ